MEAQVNNIFNNPILAQFKDTIDTILKIPDDVIKEQEARDYLVKVIDDALTEERRQQIINDIFNNFSSKRITYQQAKENVQNIMIALNDNASTMEDISEERRDLLFKVFKIVEKILLRVLEEYKQFEVIIKLHTNTDKYKEDLYEQLPLYNKNSFEILPHEMGKAIDIECNYTVPPGWFQIIYSDLLDKGIEIAAIGDKIICNNLADRSYKLEAGQQIAHVRFFPIYNVKVIPDAN